MCVSSLNLTPNFWVCFIGESKKKFGKYVLELKSSEKSCLAGKDD